MRARLALGPALALALGACSTDVHDGVGPRVPIPNVSGAVLRGDQPAASLVVQLRDPETGSVLASTRTDGGGRYGLQAGGGIWEVKVDGTRAGDFASVTREFRMLDDRQTVTLPAVSVSADGAALLVPAADDSASAPNPGSPLRFAWHMPARTASSSRVQIYAADQLVWFSPQTADSEALWNGLANQGPLQGQLVPAGAYSWRVKFLFPDSSEGRLAQRPLVLR